MTKVLDCWFANVLMRPMDRASKSGGHAALTVACAVFLTSLRLLKPEANRPLLYALGMIALLLGGCSSYGVVQNTAGPVAQDKPSYSLRQFAQRWRTDDNALMLAFSGGGTRAAALAYGVLKELRDTPVVSSGVSGRMLDEVHSISSVSGGSFTAAYYGLYGDGIFEDFEDVFLRQNIEGALLHRLLNPFRWFGTTGRTEMAVDYYEKTVFQGATFADLLRQGGPLIAINASDFAYGVRFSFVQEYFDLLCSDLSSFPVARAVTASSAVPVLFNPVVVENYPDCGAEVPDWLQAARHRAVDDAELAMTVEGLESYFDRDQRHYVHFVDGGITDNLGLRALYDITEIKGGITKFNESYLRQPPRRFILISVNASTDAESKMDSTTKQPSLKEAISAVSDVQLHRYNAATIALMQRTLARWAQEMSTPDRPVDAYFILLDLQGIEDQEFRDFLNAAPTSFSLTGEQVDGLIAAGAELLRNHPEFRRLLSDVAADGQLNP